MAPAVDDFSLADVHDYRHAVEEATCVAVLHSTPDKVLRWAYPAGDLLQAFVFFGRDTAGLALGYHGPRPADSNPRHVPTNVLDEAIGQRGAGHGDYLPDDLPNGKQVSAAAYADALVAGAPQPSYP